jgi:hypothetical protein
MPFSEIQTQKVISAYGGVGSIIETPHGAMKIENFDDWLFFKAIIEKKLEINEFIIDDNRLLNRLKHANGFPNLSKFLRVPSNVSNPNNQSIPFYSNRFISSKYFPEWFYCNKCFSFHNIIDWWQGWKRTLLKYHEPSEKIRDLFLNAPKCFYCYENAKQSQSEDGKRKRFYYELEQVRFILTSPKGEIEDIPWDKWNIANKLNQDIESRIFINIDKDERCCDNQQLKYYKSTKYSDLSGIRIACSNCNNANTLSGLFKLDLIVNESTKLNKKVVIRTSNSVYYPILFSSIYLPTQLEIKTSDAKKIDNWIEKGKSAEFIIEVFTEEGYTKESILEYIEGRVKNRYEPERAYRLKEYRFVTAPERITYTEENRNLIFVRQDVLSLGSFGISNLTQISRLKITTVQTAFTRQEPLDKDVFLSGENKDSIIKAKYTSKWANQTEFLPAIESFGEGIFIELDNSRINSWLNDVINDSNMLKRISTIDLNIQNHELIPKDKFTNIQHLAKFILIHTLSHILIKELEFMVGYPATSLNERLFIDENEMSGVLIYTVAGTEGSFGGLVSQGEEEIFKKLLLSALLRASDCASDPVCLNTIDGQGVGGLNMAACYSCSLLPETSCEEFNCFLDRALLIDTKNGFFKICLI